MRQIFGYRINKNAARRSTGQLVLSWCAVAVAGSRSPGKPSDAKGLIYPLRARRGVFGCVRTLFISTLSFNTSPLANHLHQISFSVVEVSSFFEIIGVPLAPNAQRVSLDLGSLCGIHFGRCSGHFGVAFSSMDLT